VDPNTLSLRQVPGQAHCRKPCMSDAHAHYHRTVIAYHGCDRKVADDVLLGKATLEFSKNEYDWLGSGIYFWEHGVARAYQWASFRATSGKVKKVKEPAVIGAYINLGRCFDLLDTRFTELLAQFYGKFAVVSKEKGIPIPENKARHDGDEDLIMRYLDNAVINFCIGAIKLEEETEYDTVRCVYAEGKPAFPGSKIMEKSHIQIAVRNPKCILGYFRPNVDFTG
jgi:hypothetical protein